MHESKDVSCPSCGSIVTITIHNQVCEECGVDIAEMEQQKASQVRDILQTVRETINNSQFELKATNKQGDVIRADIMATGELVLDDTRLADEQYDIDSVIERQESFEELRSQLEEIQYVSDIEIWYADTTEKRQTGSKYGMEPNLQHKQTGEAVLLIGTHVE